MVEYNYSKEHKTKAEKQINMSIFYRKISDFHGVKKMKIMIEYNHSKEHKQKNLKDLKS